jgi:hypothetical protein
LRWAERNRNAFISGWDALALLEVELTVAVEKWHAHRCIDWVHLDIAWNGTGTLVTKVVWIAVLTGSILDAWIVELALILEFGRAGTLFEVVRARESDEMSFGFVWRRGD